MPLASPETGLKHRLANPRWAGAGRFPWACLSAIPLCVVPPGFFHSCFKWNDMSRYSLFSSLPGSLLHASLLPCVFISVAAHAAEADNALALPATDITVTAERNQRCICRSIKVMGEGSRCAARFTCASLVPASN